MVKFNLNMDFDNPKIIELDNLPSRVSFKRSLYYRFGNIYNTKYEYHYTGYFTEINRFLNNNVGKEFNIVYSNLIYKFKKHKAHRLWVVRKDFHYFFNSVYFLKYGKSRFYVDENNLIQETNKDKVAR